jgi:hypothetical protein
METISPVPLQCQSLPPLIIDYTKENLQNDIEKSMKIKIKQNKIATELNVYKEYNTKRIN